ncbi:DUF1330 domain-containing protein [Rhodoblastus acidophilus]|uniref:DUF1330 domain-containing protein n=1 Tax=Candidatus Rhodoblastus alkanivorans TaxID=2954117 RepID=A0ABS9ZAW7_9HYPH|nr:DUF1330 domain-containing protein [Candidatus Rhodoblastus alkanivorans]MCI4680040.1 DUF1330 domain-containing protein [Candidatus Rhodoblastus alkanivorans]MCI4684788.1 DUF1330 domain-containing protein [Candidatus Rhodoblastus alkanivorans]MDI4642112.1 DUF1330 domain-containing protein [Rhodoblastus acidophilus]
MPVYLIADVKVTDDKWLPSYAATVHGLVHRHGGKYLARSANVKTLEGRPLDATLVALIEFPSAEAATAFTGDPDYAPFAMARQRGSESRLHLIDDTDVAGAIAYLPKG